MAEVTGVRKETSSEGGAHEHVVGVCTTAGTYYTRAQVVAGLNAGEDWHTRGSDDSQATINESSVCPQSGCSASPYITTSPDHTTANNLDNLPAC
jgi:Protein of unknown function (DUF3892)